MQQAIDFLHESEKLFRLITPLGEPDLERVTQFQQWSINDILSHLHVWNSAAAMTLSDPVRFSKFMTEASRHVDTGLRAFEIDWTRGMKGPALVAQWYQTSNEVSELYRRADPKQRVEWAGPAMSARSSITARLMETWAHGQAIFDLLGVERVDGDALRNIAHLGVSTFGWTHQVRGLRVPEQKPHVQLRAPSGAVWTWNPESELESIRGSAVEFCQVVTQTRNIADTQLQVIGSISRYWMENAQCFAGPVSEPPAPGSRFRIGK